MNGMNELETQLQSWIPRRPSRKLKHRIFGSAQLKAVGGGVGALEGPQLPTFRLGWLAPATVALLLSCVLFNHHNAFILSQSTSSGPLVAAALSNQSAAPWLPGSFQHDQNSLPVEKFDWTNASARGSASSGSTSMGAGRTN